MPRRRGESRRKVLAMWLTKGLLSGIFLFLVWAGAHLAPLRDYMRLVFVPGAAAMGPLGYWLDWQPQGEEVQPVWLLLTGRTDAAGYDLPVEGTVHSEGSRGLYIEAVQGELVRAVLDGRVAAIDIGRGEVKIFHGNTMYTSYSGCTDILVKLGDRVGARDVLGRVGQTGRVFFAVTQNGRYVDPLLRLRSEGRGP